MQLALDTRFFQNPTRRVVLWVALVHGLLFLIGLHNLKLTLVPEREFILEVEQMPHASSSHSTRTVRRDVAATTSASKAPAL